MRGKDGKKVKPQRKLEIVEEFFDNVRHLRVVGRSRALCLCGNVFPTGHDYRYWVNARKADRDYTYCVACERKKLSRKEKDEALTAKREMTHLLQRIKNASFMYIVFSGSSTIYNMRATKYTAKYVWPLNIDQEGPPIRRRTPKWTVCATAKEGIKLLTKRHAEALRRARKLLDTAYYCMEAVAGFEELDKGRTVKWTPEKLKNPELIEEED